MAECRSECPIPNAHRRLADLHQLWHQTLAAYGDPDGFRVNLNATIEATRNVTFILQSEKSAIIDFDVWYARWRDLYKADEVMRWARDARNTIVKQADLATTSVAVAKVHDNLDFARMEMKVPAVVPTEAIATALVKSAPQDVRQMLPYYLVSVERLWMAATLPEHELLDALAYAYVRLLALIQDAHQKAGSDIATCSRASAIHSAEAVELGDLPSCMRVTREARTVRVSLRDQRPLGTRVAHFHYDAKRSEENAQRYKIKSLKFDIDGEPDAEVAAGHMVELAKRVLVRDRYHERMVFVRAEGKHWTPITIIARNRQEKYALMRMLASEVERLRADAVIEIGEMWSSTMSTLEATGLLPADAPDREEELTVSVAQPGRRLKRWVTPFTRGKRGRIILGETTLQDIRAYYLEAVFKVWESQPASNDTAGSTSSSDQSSR